MNARTRSRRSSTAAMIADMREALETVLGPISEPVLLPGGASKEAWAVDAGSQKLLVRRAGGGVIHRHTLSLRHEFEVLQVAHASGVKAPQPFLYIKDLDGRSSSTATSALATSSSTRRVSSECSTGSSHTSTIPHATSPSRSSAPGASASRRSGSAGSAT